MSKSEVADSNQKASEPMIAMARKLMTQAPRIVTGKRARRSGSRVTPAPAGVKSRRSATGRTTRSRTGSAATFWQA